MKRYITKLSALALGAAALLGTAACSDFLEIQPKTFVSEDNFWNEKTDIDQMVAGTYVKMQRDAFIQRCIMWGETRSDNIAEGLDAAGQTHIYRTLRETLLSTNAYTAWVDFYAVINQCNTIIEMAPIVSQRDPVYTASDVLATQAEMKALRALCYFYLVRAFKDVPYYTYAIQSEDEVRPIALTDGDQIVKALIADLEESVGKALKAYPEDASTAYNSTRNRITQSGIYALLADLCLWDGQYAKTVQYAQQVIDAKNNEYQEEHAGSLSLSGGTVTLFQHPSDTYSKGYPLYPCFAGNSFGNDFNETFGGSENGFESVFELDFSDDGSNSIYAKNSAFGSLYGNYYATKGNAGRGFLGVSEAIVADLANSQTGRVFGHRYDVRYYTNINNPGLSSNEFSEGFVAKGVATNRLVTQASGKTLPFETNTGISVYATRNFIFYRLTDVMLMQAEALTELGEDVEVTNAAGEVTGTLPDDNLRRAFYLTWAVNRRSIMTTSTTSTSTYELTLPTSGYKAWLREAVMEERRRELMFEGKRWFDLLRRCHREGSTSYIKGNVSAKSSSGSSSSLFTNYESLFWPYNKDELKNNPLLKQKAYYGSSDEEGSFSSTQ